MMEDRRIWKEETNKWGEEQKKETLKWAKGRKKGAGMEKVEKEERIKEKDRGNKRSKTNREKE